MASLFFPRPRHIDAAAARFRDYRAVDLPLHADEPGTPHAFTICAISATRSWLGTYRLISALRARHVGAGSAQLMPPAEFAFIASGTLRGPRWTTRWSSPRRTISRAAGFRDIYRLTTIHGPACCCKAAFHAGLRLTRQCARSRQPKGRKRLLHLPPIP